MNTIKEEIFVIIDIIVHSDYTDPFEHLYDGLKYMNRALRLNENIALALHDFIWACESDTVISFDNKLDECINHLKTISRIYKIKKITKRL